MSKLGLYIHIPFCQSKCSYCDFVSFCGQEGRITEYVDALIGEMRLYSGKFAGKVFDTLYIGGGTPSVLPAHAVEKIVAAVKENFEIDNNSEITIEVNPRSLTEVKLCEYLRAGVNRISLGVQCMNDAVLKTIGRVQTVADVEKAFALLNSHGVENISADLMLGLPNETVEDINNTLNFFATHGVKHISAYGLQVEEGTPLAKKIETGEISVPNEDETTNQYEYACTYMRELGFTRYEISNFAKVDVIASESVAISRKCKKGVLPRDPHVALTPHRTSSCGEPLTAPQDDITLCHCEEHFCVTRQSRGSEPYMWRSQHNSKYWDGTEYLGLGVSASGYFNNTRYTNTKKLDEYINKIGEGKLPIDYIETLSNEQEKEERIMLSLRTERGLDLNEFAAEFGENLLELKAKEIAELEAGHMLEIVDNHLKITDENFYVSNSIILELI